MVDFTVSYIVVLGRNDVERFASLLKSYVEKYMSTDIKSLVLLAEGFGSDVVKSYISDTWIRGFLQASAQNPVLLLYVPFLRTVEPRIEQLVRGIENKVIEPSTVRNATERYILIERRETLVSLALSSKYILYMDLEIYRDYAEFYAHMLGSVGDAVKRYYDDLDLVEKVSLLYIYEVLNTVLTKLGRTSLDISRLRSVLDEISRVKPPLFSRAAVASLLYDIYKVKKDKSYLDKFYETLSDVDPKVLYDMLREAESRSTEILREYYQSLDEESIFALSMPLNEVEFALTSKLVNIIQNESIVVPIIGFSDFISEYYSIPKKLLKIWLRIALFTYKYLLTHLSTIIAATLSIILLILGYLIKNIYISAVGPAITFVVEELLKRVRSLAEKQVFKWFRSKEESAKSKARELEYRIRYFDHFIP